MTATTPRRSEPRRAPRASSTLRALTRRGLLDGRRSVLSWGLPLSLMGGLMAALWPTIEDSMDTLMESYPESLKDAFNITSISSVEAYVDAEMLSFIVPLAVAFLAVRIVAGALSGAEERGYLDIVLTTPIARRTLVAGAVLTAATVTAAVLVLITVVTWLAGVLVGADPSFVVLARGLANVWPLAMLFAGLAVLASGFLHTGGPVTAVAAGTLIAMYVLDLVGKLADPLEPLRIVSAFKYYGSAIQDGIDPLAFGGLLLAALALCVAGARRFEHRDIL